MKTKLLTFLCVLLLLTTGCRLLTGWPAKKHRTTPLPPAPTNAVRANIESARETASRSESANAVVVPSGVPIGLAWDDADDANVSGYKIYVGVAPRTYTNSYPVGNVTNTVLPPVFRLGQKYYFSATSYDADGLESVFSNEIGVTASMSTRVKITSTHAPTLSGPWMTGVVIWDVTNSPLPALFLSNMVERTTTVKWQ